MAFVAFRRIPALFAVFLCHIFKPACGIDRSHQISGWNPHEFTRMTYFRPELSKTFHALPVGKGGVRVNYHFADKSYLKGYDGQDVFQIGDYRCISRAAFITECNSGDFNLVDGILGWGYTSVYRNPALLYTISHQQRDDWGLQQPADMHILPERIFAIVAGDDSRAELQLGGIDPSAHVGELHYAPMEFVAGYGVPFNSIKYGNTELLRFASVNVSLTGIMDTGTSCLILPNSTVNGTLEDSPYQRFIEASARENAAIIFNISGWTFEFPYDEWNRTSCVDALPLQLLIGNLFFRKVVVLYDIEHSRMGLAPRREDYLMLDGVKGRWSVGFSLHEGKRPVKITKVPLYNYLGRQFHIQVGVGTPAQPMRLIFDTGSYMLALFTHRNATAILDPTSAPSPRHPAPRHAASKATVAGVAIALAALVVLGGIILARARWGPSRGYAVVSASESVEDYGSLHQSTVM